jgi:hypothetical protein
MLNDALIQGTHVPEFVAVSKKFHYFSTLFWDKKHNFCMPQIAVLVSQYHYSHEFKIFVSGAVRNILTNI